jgi:hypothetical protein
MRAFLGVSKLEIPLLDMLRKMRARKIDIDYMVVLLWELKVSGLPESSFQMVGYLGSRRYFASRVGASVFEPRKRSKHANASLSAPRLAGGLLRTLRVPAHYGEICTASTTKCDRTSRRRRNRNRLRGAPGLCIAAAVTGASISTYAPGIFIAQSWTVN